MYHENPNYKKCIPVKEVVGEMFAETKKTINVENVMTFIGSVTLGPYGIPTHLRNTNLVGVAGLAVGIVGQGAFYSYLADGGFGYTRLALIPVTTNLISCFYEWYRNTQIKIAKRQETSRLEEASISEPGNPRSWTQCRTSKGEGC